MKLNNSEKNDTIKQLVEEINNTNYKIAIEKFVKKYPDFKSQFLNPQFNQSVDQIIYSLTNKNNKCLVIENEFGNSIETLSSIFHNVYSLQHNENFCNLQRIRFKDKTNIIIKSGRIENTPFNEDNFDLIIFENFPNYMKNVNLDEIIKKISKILTPGGCFMFINKNNQDIKQIIENEEFLTKQYWSMQIGQYPSFSGKINDEIGLKWYMNNYENFVSHKRNSLKKKIALWTMKKTSKHTTKIFKEKFLPSLITCCFKQKIGTTIIDFVEKQSGFSNFVCLSRPKKIIMIMLDHLEKPQKIVHFNRHEKNFPLEIINVQRKFPKMDDPKTRIWMEQWFDGKIIDTENFEQIILSLDWLMQFQNNTKQEQMSEEVIKLEIEDMKKKISKIEFLKNTTYEQWVDKYGDFLKKNNFCYTAMHGDFWKNNILFDSKNSEINVIDWERYQRKENPFNDFMYFFFRLFTKTNESSIDLERLETFLDQRSKKYRDMIIVQKKLNSHFDCEIDFLLLLRIFVLKRILDSNNEKSLTNQKDKDKQISILQILNVKQSLFA